MRVLIVTKIFPNLVEPLSSPFNRQQFAALSRRCDVEVLATIPWFPAAFRVSSLVSGCKPVQRAEQRVHRRAPRSPPALCVLAENWARGRRPSVRGFARGDDPAVSGSRRRGARFLGVPRRVCRGRDGRDARRAGGDQAARLRHQRGCALAGPAPLSEVGAATGGTRGRRERCASRGGLWHSACRVTASTLRAKRHRPDFVQAA